MKSPLNLPVNFASVILEKKNHVFLLSTRDLNFYGKYEYTLISYFSTFSEKNPNLWKIIKFITPTSHIPVIWIY